MSFNPQSIEDMLKFVRDDDLLQGMDPRAKEKLEAKRKLAAEEEQLITRAWAEMYRDPAGRKALELLFDSTLRRTVFFAGLGTDAQQVALFGVFREGQNALAYEIARLIKKGLGDEEKLKPRDR